MNDTVKALIAFLAAALIAGCSPTHYLYRSDGTFAMSGAGTRDAVLYWYGEEGRLWYGRKYEQTDTTVNLRTCRVGTGTFAGGEAGDPVELRSDEDDFHVARITAAGDIEPLPEPERVHTGSRCGLILVEGRPVDSEALDAGVTPVVAILCRDAVRPETYPVVGKHNFEPVERRELDDVPEGPRPAPDPCPATP